MDKLITQSLDLAAVHFPPSVTVYLQPRDIIGEGIHFHGSPLSATAHVAPPREIQPADRFEVVRLLSVQTGSPSPVHTYLVRELLPPETIVESSSQAVSGPVRPTYGGEFAVKFLVKADLVRTATRRRDSTLSGIHVHRTLPTHRNIATLYRTYENETVLVLVMEHVSGANNTSQLFPVRSRDCVTSAHAHIVASAFSQMCDAVATCHEAGAFFQDILLHDFTFSFFTLSSDSESDVAGDAVVVKLKEFGSCRIDDAASSTGAETAVISRLDGARARAADVSSLGELLITMLFGRVSSKRPADGHARRSGMSAAIDDFLREHVFEPVDSSQLFGARQLGAWARGIPELFDLPPSYDATPPSSPDPSSVDRPPTRGRLSTIYEEGDSPVPWASSPVDVEKDRSRSKHPAYRCYLITSKHRSRAFQPRRPAPTQTSANYAPRRAAPLASPQNTAPNPHGEQVVLHTDTVTCSNELPVPHSPTPSTSSSAEKQHELLSTFFTSLLETNHRKDPRTEPPLKRARLSPTPDVVQPAQTQTQSPVRTFMSRARQVLLRRRPPQVGCAADMPRGIAPVIESLGSDTSFEKGDPPGFDEASQPVEELFRLSGASAASSAVSIATRNSCKSKKNVYTPPPGRVFLR